MICHLHYCKRDECEHLHVAAGGNSCTVDSFGAPAIINFKPAVFEHMFSPWERPFPIDTPQRLREECNRRGVTSEYLRDSGIWRSGPERWV